SESPRAIYLKPPEIPKLKPTRQRLPLDKPIAYHYAKPSDKPFYSSLTPI
ncbi:MAG: hypothetical protein ACI8PG_002742, partial [Planctomycetota bacterium]